MLCLLLMCMLWHEWNPRIFEDMDMDMEISGIQLVVVFARLLFDWCRAWGFADSNSHSWVFWIIMVLYVTKIVLFNKIINYQKKKKDRWNNVLPLDVFF